jgi:4'-phosphopantetheinyl transferase EntD
VFQNRKRPYDTTLFSQLFSRPVGAAAIWLSDQFFPLFPEEAEDIGNAVLKRRIEFMAGRHCARLAMAQLGRTATAIPRGPDRAPIWPANLVGSITHSKDLCAAVVAPNNRFRSIGIDVELIDSVPASLAGQILRPEEAAELVSSANPEGVDWPTLYFCLKEAVFKAVYPTCRRTIDFQEILVIIDQEFQNFSAELRCSSVDCILTFQGRYLVRHGHIHAACW